MRIVLASALAATCLWPAGARSHGRDVTEAGGRFRFVVLNDAHLTNTDLAGSRAQLRRAVDEINGFASEIAFVLVAGDLGQAPDLAGLQTELAAAKQELDRLAVPYRCALGNHDVTITGDASAWTTLFGSPSHRFEHDGVHFMALQTAVTRTSTIIPAAALDSLAAFVGAVPPGAPFVVFAHHPLGPITPFGVTNRQAFYDRVDGRALRAVFCGHYHGVFEEERNGVWYCTTRAVSEHRVNHDGSLLKGYRVASVWVDGSISSSFFRLGAPPTFAPAAPEFAATAGRLATAGRTLRVQLAARDPLGETIAYSATGLPSGASFDPTQRLLTWTPAVGQAGLHAGMRFLAANSAGQDTLALAVRVLPSACVDEAFDAAPVGWAATGGGWSVTGGTLVQSLATSGAATYTSPTGFSDCYVEADLSHDQGVGYAGLVARYVDASNYYYVWNNGSQIEVRRRVGGVAMRLGPPVPVGAVSGWHHVRFEALGSTLRVLWNGALCFETQDATFGSGAVGLVTSQAAARFDNVVAVGCAGLYDRPPVLAPIGSRTLICGVPFTLDVLATDPDAQPLSFAAAGLPAGASFDAAARRLAWTPSAADAGLWRGGRITVSDGELFDAENLVFTVIDTSEACFHEDFEAPGSQTGWTSTNGSWAASGGVLSGVSTPVSVALQTASADNFALQARLRLAGDTAIGGLVFRAQDATHYDALLLSAAGNTLELRRQRGSISSVLADDGDVLGSVTEGWHLVRVEAHDEILRVWIDGERRFEVTDFDTPYLGGRIGLRIANGSLFADDVLLEDCGATTVDARGELAAAGLRVWPNPCAGPTTTSFAMPHAGAASVTIYDAAGRTVRRLWDGALESGAHHLVWDGADDAGRRAASGQYFVRVVTPAAAETRRLVLLQ